MEDRLARPSERPGAAIVALVAILGITAAWWALALWPAGAVAPEWIVRTRAACFGARRDGLPDAGGWILLVGEPLGMLALLALVWGRALRRELRWIRRRTPRPIALSVAVVLLAALTMLSVHAVSVWAAGRPRSLGLVIPPQRVERAAPDVQLVDQYGRRVALNELPSGPTLLTFAYGHCATVCPAVVSDLMVARRAARRPDVPIVVVSLDPWRDTPDRLPTIARHWRLGPADRVLSGRVSDVERALNALGIGRRRNATTGDVDHLSTVMILDARGAVKWRLDGDLSQLAALLRAQDSPALGVARPAG